MLLWLWSPSSLQERSLHMLLKAFCVSWMITFYDSVHHLLRWMCCHLCGQGGSENSLRSLWGLTRWRQSVQSNWLLRVNKCWEHDSDMLCRHWQQYRCQNNGLNHNVKSSDHERSWAAPLADAIDALSVVRSFIECKEGEFEMLCVVNRLENITLSAGNYQKRQFRIKEFFSK